MHWNQGSRKCFYYVLVFLSDAKKLHPFWQKKYYWWVWYTIDRLANGIKTYIYKKFPVQVGKDWGQAYYSKAATESWTQSPK